MTDPTPEIEITVEVPEADTSPYSELYSALLACSTAVLAETISLSLAIIRSRGNDE